MDSVLLNNCINMNIDNIEPQFIDLSTMPGLLIKEEKGNLLTLFNKERFIYGLCRRVDDKILLLTHLRHTSIELLFDNRACIAETEGYEALVDGYGNVIVPYGRYEGFGRVYGDCIVVFDGPKKGLINKMGREILPLIYESFEVDKEEYDSKFLYLMTPEGRKEVYNPTTREFNTYMIPKKNFIKTLFKKDNRKK